MKLRFQLLAMVAAGGFAAATASNCFGAAEIHLLRSGEATGEAVLLGDVADIACDDETEAASLRQTEICPAPLVGRARKLSLGEVREALARQGINVSECKFYGASRIEVTASGEMTKAPKPIAKAATVQKSSFAKDEASGEKERNELRSPEDAKPLMLVKRGEAVALTVRAAGVKVSTAAVAQTDGAEGEMIVVRSAADRKKTFLARVVGPQAVEMLVGGPAVRDNSRSER